MARGKSAELFQDTVLFVQIGLNLSHSRKVFSLGLNSDLVIRRSYFSVAVAIGSKILP